MKAHYSAAETSSLTFHDSAVTAVEWCRGGDDLRIWLEWATPREIDEGRKHPAVLEFDYVSRFRVTMDFGEFQGSPDIYEIRMSSLPHGRWRVVLEFRGCPDGEMSFECNDVRFKISDIRDDV